LSYQKILEKYFPGTRALPRADAVSVSTGSRSDRIMRNLRSREVLHEQVASCTPRETLAWGPRTAPGTDTAQIWLADVIPALKGRAQLNSRYALPVPTGPTRFLTVSSEHFRVTYPADIDRRDANQVLTT